VINNYPNFEIELYPITIRISLIDSIKNGLKEDESLTNAVAIRILKQIKREADILFLMAKPFTLISLSVTLLTLGLKTHITLIKITLIALSAAIFTFTAFISAKDDDLFQLSKAYKQLSLQASEHFNALEINPHYLPILVYTNCEKQIGFNNFL
jgi:hypothetical protein